MRKIVFAILIIGILSSCGAGEYYFLNGAGEWERILRWEQWEPSHGERTIQTFSIGDSTYTFTPASPKADKWIAERREVLRRRAIENGRNPDWYIDRNIDEGERRDW